MFQSHLGEYAALLTAVFWTITAIAFESAGKKVGSLSTNLIRLFLAFIFIGIYSQITRGSFIPFDASFHQLDMAIFIRLGRVCNWRSFII